MTVLIAGAGIGRLSPALSLHQTGSNGASQAIRDARVLTCEFRCHGVTARALEDNGTERRPATAKIVTANCAIGPNEVLAGTLAGARIP